MVCVQDHILGLMPGPSLSFTSLFYTQPGAQGSRCDAEYFHILIIAHFLGMAMRYQPESEQL